ncbi:type II secretion system protein GspM [Polymorphobacter fuscus]|uniref:Type II secretion system protein M n=1 Tax=Sandarakinorhabdus fusca TaxID=1439888 RepID=A0A7C9LFB5_9SPHN|nr:type II secretion system protein GspM [Polymorphobacter fuscus]KAB7648990.1 type II secretion system protein M [Polymorphobacter fuscus]MQT16587.1 hypothetical protein [Polymorphobacter fuscus]
MTKALTSWWHGRTRREQILLASALVLFGLVFGWLGVLRPLAPARAEAADRLAAAEADLGEIRALTPIIRAAEARARSAGDVPAIDTIRRRATDAGLVADTIADDGAGRVTLRIAAIKPAVLLRWIADIETRDQILVDSLTVTRNGDATVAADLAFRGAAR